MIIIDERHFVAKSLEEHGFGVFDFYDNHQVLSLSQFCELPLERRADFLLVDTETLLKHPSLQEKFKPVMNTFLGVVFLHEQQNQKASTWVQDHAAFLTKIIGQYALPMPQLEWTMLSNQLQFYWNLLDDQRKLQKHIAKFSVELDNALQTAEGEMTRAKKIYEVLIPRRQEEIKGVSFVNKYASGDGGGGEFYDLHHSSNKVYQILFSSQSYLVSSALMGLLGQHKQKEFSPKSFMQDAVREVAAINGAKKKKSEVDILLLEMDVTELNLSMYAPSEAKIFSQTHGFVGISPERPYQLSKGEKLIIFSPGFLYNWKESHPKTELSDFIKNHQKPTSAALMTELFYQIRLDQSSEFLKKDATVVMMEVNRHGIHQV